MQRIRKSYRKQNKENSSTPITVSRCNKNDLELATNSIQAARLKLRIGSIGSSSLESIVGREWKVGADREIESVILDVLQKESDYPILSEESGVISGNGNRHWIVDPLDGSVNFLRRLPFYCISVGLWENEIPILGAVWEISSNRLFTGIVGVGAWCNEKPMQLNPKVPTESSNAVFCTGLPAGFEHSESNIQMLVKACSRFGKVRMLGSAALMLCYVASGRCDSYWESRISLWDVAASVAIVQAAGGVTRFGKIDQDFRVDVEAASCQHLLISELYDR